VTLTYHVMNRGDHQEPIFRGTRDRRLFLKTLGEACAKSDWQVHAGCLMGHHFHWVVETPKANLVEGMKWLLGTYTGRFNRRHQVCGHLFSGRYKALPVEASGTGYFKAACDYVHLNPARAGLLRATQKLRAFRWSSFAQYLQEPAARVGWWRVERLLGEHGLGSDTPAGRAELEKRMELRRAAEDPEAFQDWLKPWCLGSDAFREELLAQVEHRPKGEHFGAEIRESAVEKARGLLQSELERLGWKESELSERRKGDPNKLAIALRLRQETTMTLEWIAEQLQIGTKGYLSHLLYWHGRNGASA
jgi:putative transposase